MNKFKKWLIRKLGGINLSDLPAEIRLSITSYYANEKIANDYYKILENGFTSSNN